jgi:hypothetical protein
MSKTNHGTRGTVTAHRRRKDKEPLTPEMALTLLESAVSYCQQSGLNIQATNGDNGTLGLFIPNAHYVLTDNGTRAAFRLGAFYQARDDAPRVSAQG